MTLRASLLAFLLSAGLATTFQVGRAAPLQPPVEVRLQEERENILWSAQIQEYARTQSPAVRQALESIVSDAAAMSELDPHKGHDALKSTLAKIERARLQPQGAVEHERLDALVNNFGAVTEGKLYRGAQPSPAGLRWLRDQGIRRILVLREPGIEETNYPGWSRAQYLAEIRRLGMTPVELVIRDRTVPTPEQIERFLAEVEKSSQPSFVHCSAGVGRTGILCGIYERKHGLSAATAVEHNRLFQMNPTSVPDHALQASLVANYPIANAPAGPPVDLRWGEQAAGPSPLAEAIAQKRGWVVAPDTALRLDPDAPAPMLQRLADSLREGAFLRLDFGSDREIDVLASMARVIPADQKMGSLQLRELTFDGSGGLSLAQLKRARQLLGPVPFEVRASGLKREDLTSRRVDELIAQVRGQVEVLDLNLPGGENPPVEVVQQLAKAGIACTLRLADDSAVSYWNSLGIGYLGLRL